MRKQGQNIIDKRLKFKKGLQRKFIAEIKTGSKKSWSELAELLNLHPHTLCVDWYTEKTTIPKIKAKEFFEISPFEKWEVILKEWVKEELHPRWGQIKAGGKNKKKIHIPLKCSEFAEFLGCALGDGSLGRKTFYLSSDATQELHVIYIKRLIKKLFNLDSRMFLNSFNKNNLLMNTNSTGLIEFLQKNGLTIGDKIRNKASFPFWIFTNESLACAALRGLFDTDGGIYEKQKGYKRALIEFQTKSPYINKDILKLLKMLKFVPSKGNKGLNIRIQNQKEVHRFFRIIGSSNIKNIIRYKEFIKTGIVPDRDKVIKLMKDYSHEYLPFKVKGAFG